MPFQPVVNGIRPPAQHVWTLEEIEAILGSPSVDDELEDLADQMLPQLEALRVTSPSPPTTPRPPRRSGKKKRKKKSADKKIKKKSPPKSMRAIHGMR